MNHGTMASASHHYHSHHHSGRKVLFIVLLISVSFISCSLFAVPNNSFASAAEATAFATDRNSSDQQHKKQPRRRMNNKVAPLNVYLLVKDQFDKRRRDIEDFVFQTLNAFATTSNSDTQDGASSNTNNNNRGTSPSRLYTYSLFFSSLQSLSIDGILGQSYHASTNPYVPGYTNQDNSYTDDPANQAFYLSQDDPSNVNAVKYAIVNICAFLANAMVESIQFDACEEFNGMVSGHDDSLGGNHVFERSTGSSTATGNSNEGILSELNAVNGRYFPMSNACGQFGASYQNQENCYATNTLGEDTSCPIDRTLEMYAEPHPTYNYQVGKTNSIGDQPPPPLFCRPKLTPEDYSGYWDGYNVEFVQGVAYPSTTGRIDTEGCCFWGRGALMTKGTCGLGRINHYLGMKAYDDNRPSRYPMIDFCTFPSIICGASNWQLNGFLYPELKFVVGLFDWIDRVQSYTNDETQWSYMDQLKSYVDGGMRSDDTTFIDGVSSVLTRGCDDYYCSTQTIHYFEKRRRNFEVLIHDIFNLGGNLNGFMSTTQPIQPTYNFDHAMRWIHSKRSKMEGNVFVSKNNALDGLSYFSQEFRFNNFLSALRSASILGLGDQRYFIISDEKEGLRGFNAGLVNLAFFLANAMAESITNDSCDEIHWEKVGSQYAISNSCGQNGRDYSSETCPPWQAFMTCSVDTQADITADAPTTALPPFILPETQPPPFQCKPGTNPAGYWDEATRIQEDDPTFTNSYGRSDLEGCTFWGRGALHTRGSCNYGKLNFHLGAQAAADDRPAILEDIDFCTDPSAVCSDDSMEIRFVVGLFEWIDRVQDYYESTTAWSYREEIYKFVDEGFDDDSFIDAVSNIVARGCHLGSTSSGACSSVATAIDTDRFLYGLERKMNFKNIIKLVFELPVVAKPERSPWNNEVNTSPTFPSQVTTTPRPTFRPTFKPTPFPMMPSISTTDDQEATTLPPTTSSPTSPQRPTRSPFEFSDITIFNTGGTYIINNEASSFTDESVVVTQNTILMLEEGGYVVSPLNTDWPAVRVSIASTFIGRGGYLNGSYADTSFLEGDYEDGGEGIHVNNGQSSPETASRAEFYEGIEVFGGDSPVGIGGSALHVNGFGTEAFIYGGIFIGGTGMKDNGLSLYVLNSAKVHIRGGTFIGEMQVERRGAILLYGCFVRDGTKVTGLFEDETELDITIRSYYGGQVEFIPLAEQECDTAPSTSPTDFPTLSPRPTVPRTNHGNRAAASSGFMLVSTLLMVMLWWRI